MRGFLWKMLRWALWPLRLFGLGSDAYTLWSYREQAVALASALSGAIATTIFALAQRYPPWVVPLFLLVGFVVMLALAGWGVKLRHRLTERRATPALAAGTRGQTSLTTRLPDGRTLVDVTPRHLAGLTGEHTEIQADKLLEAFVGKWMRVSGSVEEVFAMNENTANVTFPYEGPLALRLSWNSRTSPSLTTN